MPEQFTKDEQIAADMVQANPIMMYRPWWKQKKFHSIDRSFRLLAWANRCLGGETEIYDPMLGKSRVVSEIDEGFRYLTDQHLYCYP